MSGLLQGIIGVVGIAAAIITDNPMLGIASGALLVSDASQQGWLGNGPKNFFNSSAGQDLTLAVGLASAAMSVSSLMSATQTATASTAVDSANSAAEGTGDTAAASQAAAATGGADSGIAAPSGLGDAAPSPTPGASLQANLTNPSGQIAAAQNGYPGIANSPATTDAVNQMTDSQSLVNMGTGAGSASGSAPNSVIAQIQQNDPALNQATNLNASGVSADQNAVAAPQSQTAANANAAAEGPAGPGGPAGAAPSTGVGGMLNNAASYIGKNPALAVMGGQALSGWAQGKAQENINQRNLAAAQWGNVQWTNPNQVAQLDAAAAAPITVPTGYLARAAAARNLMNTSSNQTAPLQSSPTAPPAAAPTVAPLGLSNPGGSGANPVPITAMGATPRGGVT
jgi:hypothetical protein